MGLSTKEKILRMLDGERTGEKFCSCNVTAITWYQMETPSIYFPEAHHDPDLMAKLGESQHTLLGFQSVNSGFFTGLEAQILGTELNMGSRENFAYITKPAFDDPASFAVPPNFFDLGLFPVHFKAISILSNKYHHDVPIYAKLRAPITLMGHFFGVEKTMRLSLKNPTLFQSLLEQVSDLVVEYGNRLIESGADALAMGDPTASMNLISPRTFKKFMVPIYRKLSEEIKGRVIMHICGDTTPILDSIPDTGFCAFSFEGPTVQAKKVKEVFGDRVALFGNIPTVDVLWHGSVEDVRKAVLQAIEDGIDSITPACSLPLQTPIANSRALSETVNEYNKSKGFY